MEAIAGYEVVDQSECYVKLAAEFDFSMSEGDRLLKEHGLIVTGVNAAPDTNWKHPVVWVTCVRLSSVRQWMAQP